MSLRWRSLVKSAVNRACHVLKLHLGDDIMIAAGVVDMCSVTFETRGKVVRVYQFM